MPTSKKTKKMLKALKNVRTDLPKIAKQFINKKRDLKSTGGKVEAIILSRVRMMMMMITIKKDRTQRIRKKMIDTTIVMMLPVIIPTMQPQRGE